MRRQLLYAVITLVSLLLSSNFLNAQEFRVKSFTLAENEVIRSEDKRFDLTSKPCALLKIQMMDQLVKVEGNVCGDIVNHGTEKWVYITDGTYLLRIFPKNHLPINLNTNDYGCSHMEGNCVYMMKLSETNVTTSQSKLMVMTIRPKKAIVAINGNQYETDVDGVARIPLPPGEYEYFITADGYIDKKGNVKIYNEDVTRYEVLQTVAESMSISEEDNVRRLITSAERGNKSAQNRLGICYVSGKGVPADEAKAFEWFQKAAAQDYAPALFSLGLCYEGGKGVTKDILKAVECFQRAADLKNVSALFKIGACYEEGIVYPINLEKAADYYMLAAERGDAEAQNKIGGLYKKGLGGLRRDLGKALHWFQKGADQGNPKALNNVALMIRSEGRMESGAKRDEKMRQAFEMFKKAADSDYSAAQNNLGECYLNGWGTEANSDAALFWFTSAARLGNEKAMNNLSKFEYQPVENTSSYNIVQSDVEYEKIDKMPAFPGGFKGLLSYLQNNLHPLIKSFGQNMNKSEDGKIVISFVVEKDGSIADVQIEQSVVFFVEKEAIQVVKNMPQWKPGERGGTPVRVKYAVPITFRRVIYSRG